MTEKIRLLRITTVPVSLHLLLDGQLSYVKGKGFEVLAVSSDGPEIDAITQQGIPHKVVFMSRKITPARDVVSLVQLIRVMRQFKPLVVHSHTPKAGLLGMLAAWYCKVPVRMHTVAGLPLMERKGFVRLLLTAAERLTYGCAQKIYPNSKGLADVIRSSIRTKTPLKIIGSGSTNGINVQRFTRDESLMAVAKRIRKEKGIGENDIVFSFIGRIVKDKGISELIRAFEITKQHAVPEQKMFLLIVGVFEQLLDPLSQDDISFLHTDPHVVLAGFQKDVRPWLLASDIFVFPSYREGFPNVVLQASCLEIPCIVSDINGCNEIIRHEDTGLIVPPKNHQALTDAMLTLTFDRKKRQNFAARARKFVAANFEQAFVWQELHKEYVHMIETYQH
jgi:glycosyltransferase involved in cell wall biosynthesis